MTDAPWTRAEQINYATFGTKEAPPEWDAAQDAIRALNRVTEWKVGVFYLDHFMKIVERYHHAEMSVD